MVHAFVYCVQGSGDCSSSATWVFWRYPGGLLGRSCSIAGRLKVGDMRGAVIPADSTPACCGSDFYRQLIIYKLLTCVSGTRLRMPGLIKYAIMGKVAAYALEA